MIRNRMATSQWSVAAMIAAWTFVTIAPAQPANAIAMDGVYNGSYAGGQNARVRGEVANASATPVKFKLSITQQDNGRLTGVFTMYLPEGSDTKAYTCAVVGNVHANRTFQLRRTKWETAPPSNVNMMGMSGTFDPDGGHGAGEILGKMLSSPGSDYEAVRDAAESTTQASATAATKEAGAPATPVARSEKRANAARPAAPSPVSSPAPVSLLTPSAPAQPAELDATVRSSFAGVYNGTYTLKQGPVKFKLTLWTQQNRSTGGVLINTTPAGVLTFYLSEGSGTNAYTCELTGFYIPTNGTWPDQIQLRRTKWETKPPRDLLLVAGIQGVFDAKGGNGAGQFSGSGFQSLRDAAESAKVASAELSNKRQPSIAGVFNGTYTRENEPPTKFKLTMMYPHGGGDGGTADLAGVATIYLPTDSGTKAYTYNLYGVEAGYGDFELTATDWDSIPPKDFKNFKAMGFSGRFVPDMTQNTARIIRIPSVLDSGPSVASNSGTKSVASKRPVAEGTFHLPMFEATWDAAESADIKGTIAAQKAVGDADQIAALKAHAEVVKNAQPKQLASKDLVRKSQAYWDGYRSDFIREVFDGGFADDVDNDPAFQSLFIDYVDWFSNTCAAYLPADHKTITITTTTTRNGSVIGTTSKTVAMDSRFVAKYVEYSGVPAAAGSDQEKEETAKTIAIAGQIFHAGGPSHGTSPADANAVLHLVAAHGLFGGTGMNKFFATEVKAGGPSAALRQMGENLLRGSTGEPSLQEAGAKIDGAEAETDKNLPPGRFTHLIDAAHAFYREPGNARLASRFETAFDETLAAKYRGVMTREEEYYYANDYANRFRGQIMQPRSYCKDPEWPRLHPAVEECIAELQ